MGIDEKMNERTDRQTGGHKDLYKPPKTLFVGVWQYYKETGTI